MSIIEINNLSKYFGDLKAVDDVSFGVEKGEIFGFLGPNGAGKTTTIRCMMDFIRPSKGKIRLLGLDSQGDSALLKGKIGYLSPDVHLYGYWTGQQHFDFLESVHGKSTNLKSLIKKLDFNPKAKAKSLSSGNKQKLGLIMALMNSPELLILDEPTAALDPLLQNSIYEILKEYRNKGCTIFISSHNLPEVEQICDRVAIIRQGKLVVVENIANLRQRKMHVVSLEFENGYKKEDFEKLGVELIQATESQLTMRIKGDLNPLMRVMANYRLSNVEITHASLEDIFLGFYERK